MFNLNCILRGILVASTSYNKHCHFSVIAGIVSSLDAIFFPFLLWTMVWAEDVGFSRCILTVSRVNIYTLFSIRPICPYHTFCINFSHWYTLLDTRVFHLHEITLYTVIHMPPDLISSLSLSISLSHTHTYTHIQFSFEFAEGCSFCWYYESKTVCWKLFAALNTMYLTRWNCGWLVPPNRHETV